jgi:hypothetical protein
VRSSAGAYAPDGAFDVERMLDALRADRERSLVEGYAGTTITGEMALRRRAPARTARRTPRSPG